MILSKINIKILKILKALCLICYFQNYVQNQFIKTICEALFLYRQSQYSNLAYSSILKIFYQQNLERSLIKEINLYSDLSIFLSPRKDLNSLLMLTSKDPSIQAINNIKSEKIEDLLALDLHDIHNPNSINQHQEHSYQYVRLISNDQESRSDFILLNEKSIVKENISRLKSLLQQKKQITRRNRLELSPDVPKQSSKFDKQNKNTASKGETSYRGETLYSPSRAETNKYNNTQKSHSKNSLTGKFLKNSNQSLVNDIKKKIKGSFFVFNNDGMSQSVLSPAKTQIETVYFYQDKQIKNNKNIYALVQENQRYLSQIEDKKIKIKGKNEIIQALQQKIQQLLNLNKQNQQKFHIVLIEKDQEIKKLNRKFLNQKEEVCTAAEQTISKFYFKMNQLSKKVNLKLNRFSYKIEDCIKPSLKKAMKKIKLEKLIFVNQSPYRKSKNSSIMSPDVKGDTFQELQQQRHQQQKQQIEKEIQIAKINYQQTILYHEIKYKDLSLKFMESQRKNKSLTQQIEIIKKQQLEKAKEKQKNEAILQRKIEQQNNKLQDYNLRKSQIKNSILKQTGSGQINYQRQREKVIYNSSKSKQKRPAYVKKQISPLSFGQGALLTPIHQNSIKTNSIASQAALDERKWFKNSYVNLNLSQLDNKYQNQIKNQKNKTYMDGDQNQIKMRKTKSNDILENNDINKKQSADYDLKKQPYNNQSKISEQNIQKTISQKTKLKTQYLDEIQHIKSMLKKVEQHNLQQNSPINTQKKMKEVAKIQNLAKKQKKQKQIIQSKLQSLERQLYYQKNKNKELQNLVEKSQREIFNQIKQNQLNNEKQSDQFLNPDEESLILQEEKPFNLMEKSIAKRGLTSEPQQARQWQSRVRNRLQNVIQRLDALQNKKQSKIQV